MHGRNKVRHKKTIGVNKTQEKDAPSECTTRKQKNSLKTHPTLGGKTLVWHFVPLRKFKRKKIGHDTDRDTLQSKPWKYFRIQTSIFYQGTLKS